MVNKPLIDNEIMTRLEQRAALQLTDRERSETIAQMNAVLSCLEVLRHYPDSIPQESVPGNTLRPDDVLPSTDRAALLSNAPETDDVFILVPRTVE